MTSQIPRPERGVGLGSRCTKADLQRPFVPQRVRAAELLGGSGQPFALAGVPSARV